MNKLKKWLIGALVTATLIAGSIISTRQKELTPKREPIVLEKTISFENPQITLNDAFNLCKPEHLSEVMYDPDFQKSDDYIRKRFVGYSRRLLEDYLQQTRTGAPSHDLCVADILEDVGDGKKRTVFARRDVTNSPGILCLADLENSIYHEDIHAREARYGYDFGDRTIKGRELADLFSKGEIRTEIARLIGEFDAYASQIERAEKTERKPSPMHIISATTNLYQVYNIIKKALTKNTLKPLERKYAEEKIARHKTTIETLKKYK